MDINKENAEVITATELMKINPNKIKYEGQSSMDDNGDYVLFYSIYTKFYQVKTNLFNI